MPSGIYKHEKGKHWKIKDTSKMKGHIFTDERKKKISDGNKNKIITPEFRKKMSFLTSKEKNPRWSGGISQL
jgi:hypothetical protein